MILSNVFSCDVLHILFRFGYVYLFFVYFLFICVSYWDELVK